MKRLILILLIILSLTFLFGCSNNQEREIICKAKCLNYCEQNNLTYIPVKKITLHENSCVIGCICQKVEQLTVTFLE